MQKYKHKIDQEARKEIVFGHIANPKVSEIENTNEAYLNQKNQKKMTDYARLSMDETDRREFQQKKKKMLSANGTTSRDNHSLQSVDTVRTG